MSHHDPEENTPGIEENPPVFQKWKSWYWLVMGNLAFLIILFLLLSRAYQ